MQLKPGVQLAGLRPEAVVGMMVVSEVYFAHGDQLTVTSVADGTHMQGSRHYQGWAFDCRLPKAQPVETVVKAIRAALGAEFDVVREADHVHVEWDPKLIGPVARSQPTGGA